MTTLVRDPCLCKSTSPQSTSTTRTTNNSITDHFDMFICKSTSPRSTSTTRITNNSITDGVQAICLVGFLRSLVSQDHHSQFVDCQDSHAFNIHNVFLDAGSIISDRGGCRRINWKSIFLWETFTEMRQGFFLQTKEIMFCNFLLDRESLKQAGAGFISNEPSGYLLFCWLVLADRGGCRRIIRKLIFSW